MIAAFGFNSQRDAFQKPQPNLKVHYRIIVPTKFNLDLNTFGGSIKVNESNSGMGDGHLDGNVDVSTAGGSLSLLRINGSVSGHTSGGNIEATGCTGDMDFHTSGGNIDIQSRGNVKAETMGGSISAVWTEPIAGGASLSTTGGDITVKLPEAAAVNIDATTAGDSIDCDLPVQAQGELGRGRLTGKLNGGGPTLLLRTMGGGVRIRKTLALNPTDRK